MAQTNECKIAHATIEEKMNRIVVSVRSVERRLIVFVALGRPDFARTHDLLLGVFEDQR
jgi:hypothetical protein